VGNKKQNYALAFTHLRNNQNISAYNLFINLAEEQKKNDLQKASIFYLLAGECKKRQGKTNGNEFLEAGKLFLELAKKSKGQDSKAAYLCASKCFRNGGNHNDAKTAFKKSKEIKVAPLQISRPVVIIDDSKAVTIKLESYLKKLGYNETLSFFTGQDGIDGCKKLIKDSRNPIILLDMQLPDIDGDVVATKILEEKLDLQIILITADEKTTKRVNKTISSGVTAFIQKPFTIDEVKKSLDVAETEYSLSQ